MTTAQALKKVVEELERQEESTRIQQAERARQAQWEEEERARQEFWRKRDALWSGKKKISVKDDVLTIEKPVAGEPVPLPPLWLKWARAKIPCRLCGGMLYPDQMYLLDQNWRLGESPVGLWCSVCHAGATAHLQPNGKWRVSQQPNE